MITWTRGIYRQMSQSFNTREFTCSCGLCRDQMADPLLIEKLQALRDYLGYPLRVSSGYRCERKQAMLLNDPDVETVPKSSHSMGQAADLQCSNHEALVKAAPLFFKNVGTGPSFVHVDVRPGGPRRWTYSK